jgi:hypothetical protein
MQVKKAGLSLLLLSFLSACATQSPSPTLQKPPEKPIQKQAQNQPPIDKPNSKLEQRAVQGQVLTLSRMLASLGRIASTNDNEAKQLIQRRQSEATELDANDRFELILLLSQKGTDDKSLKQAQRLLEELETEPRELGAREILLMQRRILSLEQRYRSERRKRVELGKKIEHLKGLEQELDESNRRIEEPLPAQPEPAQ